MPFDANAFFADYRATFASFDAAAVCRFFHYPNMIVSSEDTLVNTDAASMEVHIKNLLDFYKEKGATEPRIQLLLPTELSPWLYQVSVTWGMFDDQDRQLVRFHTTYTLRRVDDSWKIVLVIAHDEQQAFERAEEESLELPSYRNPRKRFSKGST
ncbi:MAG: hypothetical protein QNK37_10295 [Acidobacteriota bacterium]|nr:hypothetical protein [Acidobacteriota bacterium]